MNHACPLLDAFTLSKLISPVTMEEFFQNHWEAQPLILKRNAPTFYQGLFSLGEFDEFASHAPTRLRAALHKIDDSVSEGEASYGQELPLNNREAVMAELRKGSSLILNDAHHRNNRIGTLCRVLEQEINFPIQANAYITPANGKGFSAHYDDRDVFLLQIEESKDWQISRERVTIPKRGEPKDPNVEKYMTDARQITVQPGDLIYIPGGFVHEAQSRDQTSLHITLGVEPPSWEDLLFATVKMAVLNNNQLRKALPIGFIYNNDEATADRLRNIIEQLSEPDFLRNVVNQFSNEFITKFQPDISGQIAALFGTHEMSIDETVGPRLGMVFKQLHLGDTVVILVGDRQIAFPDFLDEALTYCLNTPHFQVGNIPGDFEDDEKLVIAARLVQEGLLVSQ